MVARTKKFRGSRTHGRGMKAGRGAGKRGRGLAGLHKHKFMHMLKYYPDHFGRKGFKRPPKAQKEKNCINLIQLEEVLPKLLEAGIAKKDNDLVHLDLERIGVDKLLAKGKIKTKLKLAVGEASEKAKAKIEASGGQIVLTDESKTDEEKTDKEPKKSDENKEPEVVDAGGT